MTEQHFPRFDFVVKCSFEDLIRLTFQSSECIVAAIDYLDDPKRGDWNKFATRIDVDCGAYFHCDGNEGVHGTGSRLLNDKEGINSYNLESLTLAMKLGLYQTWYMTV